MINEEYFAVNVGKVLEVLQKQKITRVPNAIDDIVGVTNFRGDIIPVFETRKRFNLPPRETDQKYVIIVLEVERDENKSIIGAITDKVKDVINIDDKAILPVPRMNNGIKEDLISGIFKLNEDYIMLLDVDKLFSEQEIKSLPEHTQAKLISS
jgi:purine-binding chemotaxis protein CheW